MRRVVGNLRTTQARTAMEMRRSDATPSDAKLARLHQPWPNPPHARRASKPGRRAPRRSIPHRVPGKPCGPAPPSRPHTPPSFSVFSPAHRRSKPATSLPCVRACGLPCPRSVLSPASLPHRRVGSYAAASSSRPGPDCPPLRHGGERDDGLPERKAYSPFRMIETAQLTRIGPFTQTDTTSSSSSRLNCLSSPSLEKDRMDETLIPRTNKCAPRSLACVKKGRQGTSKHQKFTEFNVA